MEDHSKQGMFARRFGETMKRLWITDEWIGGISDGLTLPCALCGHIPHFDYRVDDKFWNCIVHESIGLGVVCLSCLDKLATAAGLDVADHIEDLQFTGMGKTIVFAPEKTYYYVLHKWGKDKQHKELNDFIAERKNENNKTK